MGLGRRGLACEVARVRCGESDPLNPWDVVDVSDEVGEGPRSAAGGVVRHTRQIPDKRRLGALKSEALLLGENLDMQPDAVEHCTPAHELLLPPYLS